MATKQHATTEEQASALGNIRRKPMQIDLLTGELVTGKPKSGNGSHIQLKRLGIERPAVPGMASWAGGGPEGKRCRDCAHLGAITVRRPSTDIERAAVACLRFVQRRGRLPAVRSNIANCLACDQFAEPSGVRAYFVNLDGVTQAADWLDHRGVGRFLALGEREDPERPGHLAPLPSRR
jgi:hypothetical protein